MNLKLGGQLVPQKRQRRNLNFDHPWQLYCHILLTLRCDFLSKRCCVRFPSCHGTKKEQHESALCFGLRSVYCALKIPLCCVDTGPDVFTWHLEMLASGPLHMEGEQPVDCEGSQLQRTRLEVPEKSGKTSQPSALG